MSMTREEILADVRRMIEAETMQPDDICVQDLIDLGWDNTRAEKYLNDMVERKERIKVSVVVEGRRRNAFRLV